MTPLPTPPTATPAPPPHSRPLRNGNPPGNPNLAPRAACPRVWPAGRQKTRRLPLPRPGHAERPLPAAPAAHPSALDPLPDQLSLLERELAARKVGLRVRISEPDQPAAPDAPKPNSAFSRIIPMNPETTAPAQPAHPTPTKAEALRTATLAALPNRAARRRWKAQQRRLHRGSAT